MKSFITIAFIVFFTMRCFAQDHSTQSLQKFTELKVYDRITVTLIKGGENRLLLSGENREDVNVFENNGVLTIKMGSDQFISSKTIAIKLYYTESLAVIDANENAKIISDGTLKGTKLEIKAQEAGIVSLALDMEYVMVKCNSSSETTIIGTTQVQDVSVNTGGKVYHKELFAKETNVTVLAGGHAEVHGTEKVIAKVKAGGFIVVYGKPKIIEKDDTFGGKIEVSN